MMPVLAAHGAGVRRRRCWLFRDLDVSAEPGDLLAVVGPPASGRTTLLLALARRFRLSAGKVAIDGTPALGYVPEVTAPEPVFTVAEHVRERLVLLGRKRGEPVDLLGLDPAVKGRDLTPYEKQVLGLVLAKLSNPALIALDGLDDGLDAAEQEALFKQLAEIAADGTTVVFTARDIDPESVTTVIRLSGRSAGADDAPVPTVTTRHDEPTDEPSDEPTDEPGDEPSDEPDDEPHDEPNDEGMTADEPRPGNDEDAAKAEGDR
jgi:ABC-2 type transport system ATP-binding protein